MPVTIEKTDMHALLTPDVYGSSPFEHEATAEPMNSVFVLRPVKAAGSWQVTATAVGRVSLLPTWMTTR